ncbi:MAG: FAD-binding oxidoreductase [Deltaproteobacteria bacterium]|nr:FAD-binding oxidoreductase [Deltaproteobacteria bacterium]MBW2413387.1 FAD-binding oxidoreductase [Deltaproteobacteria bacterium]
MAVYDFAVIGAGIAGASVAYELQASGRTVLLEREPLPGYHTTGRSAAFLVESYGSQAARLLTRAGRGFLEEPPDGFAEHPLVDPKPVLWIARPDQCESLEAALQTALQMGADVRRIGVPAALELCPALRSDYLADALVEPGARSIDVAGLLECFLRGFRGRGGDVVTKSPVTRIERTGEGWRVDAGRESYRVGVVVNAAGAWCDPVADMAGARPLGIQPMRRTAITFDPPPAQDISRWPCVIDADEDFYFKPEGGQVLASPCDETPFEPCDVTPDDYEVALAADRVERATTISVKHIRRRWAGLRSFAPDRSPVIGMDPRLDGFFWLAGQGGFGIMTSPGASRSAASLIVDGRLPADVEALGLAAAHLSPARFGTGSAR